MIIILCTCPKDATKKITKAILGKRLAACVNIIPGVNSFYFWKGELQNSKEELLMMKTKDSMFNKVKKAIKQVHPYEVPEIISIKVLASDKNYKKWVEGSIKK